MHAVSRAEPGVARLATTRPAELEYIHFLGVSTAQRGKAIFG